MIERIMVPGVMAPVSHYCHVVRAGQQVWVSGIVGMDEQGQVPKETVAQFDLAIDVMDRCLAAAGARVIAFRAPRNSDLTSETVLEALEVGGYVVRYEADGKCFGWIPSWHDHQKVRHDEAKSRLPEPPAQLE